MNNLLVHFSKYAISEKHTLNIIGGIDDGGNSSGRCLLCNGTVLMCGTCREKKCSSGKTRYTCIPRVGDE